MHLFDMSRQSALADSDMTCQYVAVRIVTAVLRPEGDGRVLEEAFKTQTPSCLGRRHVFRGDLSGSIDRIGGQHTV